MVGVVSLLAGVALAVSATSLAGNGSRLFAAADQHPHPGTVFGASAHGFAAKQSLLYLYLDRKACRSTYSSEAKRFTTFKAGQSYFRNTRKAFVSNREHGQFDKAFSAIAGNTPETEYVCAYLTTRNSHGRYTVTAAYASAHYFVTG
jgi:hypothetical protein